MRIFQLAGFVVLILCSIGCSQSSPLVSPGLRVSGVFGKEGGITVGGEMTVFPADGLVGIPAVYDLDYAIKADRWKLHVGTEVLFFETGPSITYEKGKLSGAWNFTGWLPIASYPGMTYRSTILLIPFYNYTARFHGDGISEFGMYFKSLPSNPFDFRIGC